MYVGECFAYVWRHFLNTRVILSSPRVFTMWLSLCGSRARHLTYIGAWNNRYVIYIFNTFLRENHVLALYTRKYKMNKMWGLLSRNLPLWYHIGISQNSSGCKWQIEFFNFYNEIVEIYSIESQLKSGIESPLNSKVSSQPLSVSAFLF